ncbi:MAG TPA: S8 family serine peptidase [Blastocatellia bacterium]|nr:S8 family serine peptidase [Blastocatellia bacterium]
MTSASRLRFTLIAFAIVVVMGVLLTGQTALTPRAAAQSPLKSVIVELAGDPVVVAKAKAAAAGRSFNAEAYRQQVTSQQQAFLNRLNAAGVTYTVSSIRAPNGPVTATIPFRFSYVYNGITLEVPEGVIPIIAALEDVIGIHPNVPIRAHLDHAINYIRAPQLYGNPARLTGFDALNTGGLEGDGIYVAVIDTGVDWTHEMFGADPTPPQFGAAPAMALATNRKVVYYLNLTAGAVSDDFGHGTHVAGDIAGYKGFAPGPDHIPGTNDDIAVHGVAPQAKIMAYKALSAVGQGAVASIIACIEDAVQPRTVTGLPKPVAHVINLSLGGTGGPDSPASVAADNAALAGSIVVASAGNSGPGDQVAGTGTVGSPGSGRRVITVGANNDPGPLPEDVVGDRLFDSGRPLDLTDVLDPASINRDTTGAVDGTGKAIAAGQRTSIPLKQAGGSTIIGNPLAQYYVFCGNVTTAADVPDTVAGRIAIARVTGAFATAVNSIAAKGAAAVLVIRPDLAAITIGASTVPVWSIQESDARYLLDLLSSSDQNGVDPAKGVLSEYPVRVRLGEYSPAMATFSSRGPVEGFGQVKPDVTAPGVQILSSTVRVGGVEVAVVGFAYMVDPSGYKSANGTSFSCPITAGVAALVKQKHPDWTPSMIRAALVNTATNLRQPDGTPLANGVNSINEQGGGLIDAFAAANAKALMGVGQPGPTGQPQGRTFGLTCIAAPTSAGCLSPTNPDFTPSYSFGVVPIANVIGTATLSQTVTIHDVTAGGGAGNYQLAARPVAGVDQTNFRVSFTDANGNAISSIVVPARASASFNVKTEVNGESITSSLMQAQWYVTATRTDGQSLRMPFYYRAVRPSATLAAPSLAQATDTEVSGSPVIDINGSYSLAYSFAGSPAPTKFRIEEQKDGGPFTALADVPANQTSFAIANRGNGTYNYRVAGLFGVQYGLLQGPYSAVQTVQVNRRVESDVTSLIQTALSNMSLANGVFEFDQTLKNASADKTILPPLRFTVTSINSASGTVRVANADNGGNGVESAATFDYSPQLGSDRSLVAGETSGARHLKFSDPASELFEFTAIVKGQFPDPAFSAASVRSASEKKRFKLRLRFIADPATGRVSLAGIE